MDRLPPELGDCNYGIDIKACTSKKRRVSKDEVSDEIRKLVIRALKMGICSKRTAATTFNIPYSTVMSIYNECIVPNPLEENESVLATTAIEDKHVQFFLDSLAENCKYTLKDLKDLTKNKFGLDISTSKIATTIPPFHYSFQRIEDLALTTITPEIMTDHKEYCELFLQLKESERLLIYFDETEFEVTMKRFSGKTVTPTARSKTKNPLVTPPSVRLRHKTIMASMTQNDLIFYRSYNGGRNEFRLIEYLKGLFDVLSKRRITGAVLIMGNTAFNHCHEITKVTQLAGHEVVFLPACSSFLNPIENMFSQWPSFIRSMNPTTETELEGVIDLFEGVLSVEQCKYYYDHVINNVTCCVTGRLIYSNE